MAPFRLLRKLPNHIARLYLRYPRGAPFVAGIALYGLTDTVANRIENYMLKKEARMKREKEMIERVNVNTDGSSSSTNTSTALTVTVSTENIGNTTITAPIPTLSLTDDGEPIGKPWNPFRTLAVCLVAPICNGGLIIFYQKILDPVMGTVNYSIIKDILPNWMLLLIPRFREFGKLRVSKCSKNFTFYPCKTAF